MLTTRGVNEVTRFCCRLELAIVGRSPGRGCLRRRLLPSCLSLGLTLPGRMSGAWVGGGGTRLWASTGDRIFLSSLLASSSLTAP